MLSIVVCLWTAGPSLLFTLHICMIVTSVIHIPVPTNTFNTKYL